jgi:hypothetical protein
MHGMTDKEKKKSVTVFRTTGEDMHRFSQKYVIESKEFGCCWAAIKRRIVVEKSGRVATHCQ